LVDLDSSCCFTSYSALFSALLLRPAKVKEIDKIEFSKTVVPSNFLLLNLYIPACCGVSAKFQNPFNFCGTLLPPKEP
jgi:hypothetical protein